MKYIAVLDTDEFEDFNFFEDGKEKYLHAIDANSVNGEWIYLPFKPLELEPIPKNDLGVDCISRADALDCVNWGYNLSDVYKKINVLPSVTPQEPRKGHWNDIPKYTDIAWQCSECEHFTTMKHNYCPECGAKMVDPQEVRNKK